MKKRGKEITINPVAEPKFRQPTQEQLEEGRTRRAIEDILERRELARLERENWFEDIENDNQA